MTSLTDVNLVAVVAATVANMIMGMIWYSPKVFGTAWMKLTGMTQEKAEQGMKRGFGLGILGAFIKCYFLGVTLKLFGAGSVKEAMMLGIVLLLALVLPGALDETAWEQRPAKLMKINFGWAILSTLVTLAILYKLG